MPRPDVSGDKWGGYDIERLRIAGLYRHILERLRYLHICTPNYCLKGRASCRFSGNIEGPFLMHGGTHIWWLCVSVPLLPNRFFFPWPEQSYQCYDLNTERVAMQRPVSYITNDNSFRGFKGNRQKHYLHYLHCVERRLEEDDQCAALRCTKKRTIVLYCLHAPVQNIKCKHIACLTAEGSCHILHASQ
jgi:hypothetical protein